VRDKRTCAREIAVKHRPNNETPRQTTSTGENKRHEKTYQLVGAEAEEEVRRRTSVEEVALAVELAVEVGFEVEIGSGKRHDFGWELDR